MTTTMLSRAHLRAMKRLALACFDLVDASLNYAEARPMRDTDLASYISAFARLDHAAVVHARAEECAVVIGRGLRRAQVRDAAAIEVGA